MDSWTGYQPLKPHSIPLVMVETLLGVSVVLHLTPWPILIYFLRVYAGDLSICVLGNNRLLRPPPKPGLIFFFFFSCHSWILSFFTFFAATSSRLNRFRSASGFQSLKTGFLCPLFSIPLYLLSYYNLSLLHPCVYLYVPSRLCSSPLGCLHTKKKIKI